MGKSIMGYMFGDGEPEETKTIIGSDSQRLGNLRAREAAGMPLSSKDKALLKRAAEEEARRNAEKRRLQSSQDDEA